ncbi:MAG: hypothetical protein WCG85_26825 [Polyangia bacterium]
MVVFDSRPVGDREEALPPDIDENAVQIMRDQLLFEQYGGRNTPEDEADNGDEPAEIDGDDADAELDGSAEAEDGPTAAGDDEQDVEQVDGGRPDSYSVPAFERARRYLGIVDNWADRVKRAVKNGNAALDREWLHQDGEMLVEAFSRQVARDEKSGAGSALAIGARLAAEELAFRLKHFEEA